MESLIKSGYLKTNLLFYTGLSTISQLITGCQSIPQQSGSQSYPLPQIISPAKPIQQPQQADYSDLYLQGTFNWWSANDSYRVTKVGRQLYRTQAHLVADGQYYDFKFANKGYGKGKNCGYRDAKHTILKAGGAALEANCHSKGNYFRFNPTKTGRYYFYFDHTDSIPKVYIRREL